MYIIEVVIFCEISFYFVCFFLFLNLPQPNEQQISVYYAVVVVFIIKSYCGKPMNDSHSLRHFVVVAGSFGDFICCCCRVVFLFPSLRM